MKCLGSFHRGAAETNPTRNHEVAGSIPGLTLWVKGSGVAVSCGVGHRHSLDLALLWLWYRPAAVALIRPLTWEPPCAAGVALKKIENIKKKRQKKEEVCLKHYRKDCCKVYMTSIYILWCLPPLQMVPDLGGLHFVIGGKAICIQ